MKTKLTQDFHLHHIVPKYKGGADTADNLVVLHPIDHAIWHLVRYRMYNNPADLHAAKILMGSLGDDGMPISTKGIKRPEFAGDNNPAKRSGHLISAAKKGITTRKGYTLSEAHKQKIGAANKRPTGKRTLGSTGMHWYNNGVEAKFLKQHPGEGWQPGRVVKTINKTIN